MNKSKLKKITSARLFLPIVCLIAVLLLNVIRTPDFFNVSIRNGVLYGYIVDVINRASELVILAIGMTLVTAASGGQDISVGAIMAVVVIYFHRLNPFSPKKTEKQKKMTLQLWVKVVIASIPAGVVGILFNDFIEEKFNNSYVVATMLIVVGVLFIVIENRHKGRKPQITKISQMGVPVLIWIGVFQMLAMIPGTSRSGATIIGALALGVSRTAAADFTFFLAIPAMAGASLVKLRHFGFDFTGIELGLLLLGCVVSFVVSILAIKFLLKYIQNHDFKAFGYYRIVLGIIVFLYFGIYALLA